MKIFELLGYIIDKRSELEFISYDTGVEWFIPNELSDLPLSFITDEITAEDQSLVERCDAKFSIDITREGIVDVSIYFSNGDDFNIYDISDKIKEYCIRDHTYSAYIVLCDTIVTILQR